MAHEIAINNPYNLAVGAACYTIMVKAHFIGHDKVEVDFEGAYAIPKKLARYHPDSLEGASTLAFQEAQKNGLKASMMVFCQFYYFDDEEEDWVEIIFGE